MVERVATQPLLAPAAPGVLAEVASMDGEQPNV